MLCQITGISSKLYVKINNLASHILGLHSSQANERPTLYGYEPMLVQPLLTVFIIKEHVTFLLTGLYIGETKGHGKLKVKLFMSHDQNKIFY
jgi:hypothetical protein